MSNTTLLCDITCAPIDLVPMHLAVASVAVGRAQALVVDETRRFRSAYLDLPAPVVAAVPMAIPLTKLERKRPTRRVVVARDDYRCQYCLEPVVLRSGNPRSATIDHVKPKCRFERPGDAHTWENVVTACYACNQKKADRLPMEVGMWPVKAPRAPSYVAARWAGRLHEPAHVQWVSDYYRLDPELVRAR